jgi:hypothetical protein
MSPLITVASPNFNLRKKKSLQNADGSCEDIGKFGTVQSRYLLSIGVMMIRNRTNYLNFYQPIRMILKWLLKEQGICGVIWLRIWIVEFIMS